MELAFRCIHGRFLLKPTAEIREALCATFPAAYVDDPMKMPRSLWRQPQTYAVSLRWWTLAVVVPLTVPSLLGATPGMPAISIESRSATAQSAFGFIDNGHPSMTEQIDYLVATQEATAADYDEDPSWALAPRGIRSIFADGFESGDVMAWSGTTP
jgi:hypothetical protein